MNQDYRRHAEELSAPALNLVKQILIKHEAAILAELHTVVVALKVANDEIKRIRSVVQEVLDDSESQEGGWGPDVTMIEKLRKV